MKFTTNHEIFDEISSFNANSSVLVLDETAFESLVFLEALLSKLKCAPHVFTCQSLETKFNVKRVNLREYDINELNVLVTRSRDSIKKGIVVHHYLPHLLVKEDEERVLRMLEDWIMKGQKEAITEFYVLPRRTFPSFEKKLQALCDGAIVIRVSKTGETYQPLFSMAKACKPEYHLKEFPYIVEDSKLLIRWGEEFTERLPTETEAKVRRKVAYMKDHINSLKLSAGSVSLEKLTPYDYMLLTQLIDVRLDEIGVIFPDMFEDVLNKVARWNLQGIIKMEEAEPRETKPVKGKFGIGTRIALALPDRVAIRLLGGKTRTVPLESYLGIKKLVETLCSVYMPTQKEPVMALPGMEEFIHQMATRVTAIERIRTAGEDPRIKFDMKYLPKIVSLTLQIGWQLKPKITKKSAKSYEISIPNCFICEGTESDSPVCQLISGSVIGACAQSFKQKFTCNEIRCKAMGDDQCVFALKSL